MMGSRTPGSTGIAIAVAILALLVASSAAIAGPPFVTDDPEPTSHRHFEIYLFSDGSATRDGMSGSALGLEINYGALPNLQISASLPVGYSAPSRARMRLGVTDAEFGVKYRFIQEGENWWQPQVSFYPSVEAAIASEIGEHSTRIFLPLWVQKSFGPWTTFGGGGYRINPGVDGRNSWFVGWAILRRLGECLHLGAEIFRETAEMRGEKDATGVDLAAIYDLSEAFHLVGSAGPEFGAPGTAAALSYYLGLEWTT